MMLPSPVTSTPFSVKDILNLEQQQDPHYGAQLPHHLEHHFHPAACLLAAADGARFSDGEEEEDEEKLSYLSPMAAPGSQADARISADNYVHAVLRGSCEAPGPGEELEPAVRDPSKYRPRRAPLLRPALPGRARARSPRCVPSPAGHRPAKRRSRRCGRVPAAASPGHVQPGLASRAATALLHTTLTTSLVSASAGKLSAGLRTGAAGSGPRYTISVVEKEERGGLGPTCTRCGRGLRERGGRAGARRRSRCDPGVGPAVPEQLSRRRRGDVPFFAARTAPSQSQALPMVAGLGAASPPAPR